MPILETKADASANAYGLLGASGLPIVKDGLQLYLDNSAASYPGSGTTWYDLSGNGKNFTWNATPSWNSTGVKSFNTDGKGASGPASNSFGITNTSGYTFYLLVNQNSYRSTAAFKWYSSNGSGSSGRGIFSHCTWSGPDIYWDQGGCCNADTRTSGGISGINGAWNIITYRCNYSATNRQIKQNNSTIIATNTSGIANINLNATAAQIATSDEYGTTWDAKIAGFLVYNRALSDTEMTTNYTYLRTLVGI